MEYRKLSNSGLEVSKICLGTMNFGQQVAESDAHEQLDYATSSGINFIDTAEVYPIPPERIKQGTTERFVGNWLKKSGKRNDLIIASKVSGIAQASVMGTRDSSGGLTRDNIKKAIDGTLERLQVDYIDLYQVHVPDRISNYFGVRNFEKVVENGAASIEETLDGLAEVVKSGKVRFIGVSNETPWGVMEYLRLAREKCLPRVVSIQNQYSLTNRTFEIGLSEICVRENIAVLPYSPLGGGVLSGKYLDGARPANARHILTDRNRERYNAEHLQPAIKAYVEIARKHDLDPVQMALAFVNDRPFVTSNIIGATTLEQLKSDIALADMVLSAEVMADIARLYKLMPDPQA